MEQPTRTVEPKRDLVDRAIAGEQGAAEELLLTYYDRLSRRIRLKLPASLRGVVSEEDILQETFTEVFQRIRSLEARGERAFFRWLVIIAEHRLQDAIKARNTQKRGGNAAQHNAQPKPNQDSVDELIELVASSCDTPSKSVARHEAVAAIQVGLAALKEDHQQALTLRYFDGLSLAAIAKTMNRTQPAVRNLCHRGLKDLRLAVGRSSQFFLRR